MLLRAPPARGRSRRCRCRARAAPGPAATATAEPRARAARDELRIERVARHAIGRAHADEPGRELIEIGLADDQSRRPPAAARPQVASAAGLIGEGRTGRGGRQARDVDVVLDRDRDAVKRALRASLARERTRLGDHFGFVAQRDEDRPGRHARGCARRLRATVSSGLMRPARCASRIAATVSVTQSSVSRWTGARRASFRCLTLLPIVQEKMRAREVWKSTCSRFIAGWA